MHMLEGRILRRERGIERLTIGFCVSISMTRGSFSDSFIICMKLGSSIIRSMCSGSWDPI